MTIVTNYGSTGHSGEFSTTSGDFTVAGTLTTDKNDKLVTIKGTVTKTATSENNGTFSLYFTVSDNSAQDAIMTALKAVRSAVQNDITPA